MRQLRNVIEGLHIIHGTSGVVLVDRDMLPPELNSGTGGLMSGERMRDMLLLGMREAREEFERDYLAAQLQRFGENITRTAEFIGMERSALHRKIRSLSLDSHNGVRKN